MKIILIRICIVIVSIMVLGGLILGINKYLADKQFQERLSQFSGEYQDLAQSCLKKEDSVSCCIASVQAMQNSEGTLTPEK